MEQRMPNSMQETKIGNVTLMHGDCMDYMRGLPDKSFDLAIVDPPYGDANFQNPLHPMSRDGGGGSTVTNDRWNRFGARFDRYKRAMPTADTHGTTQALQKGITPPENSQHNENQINKKGIWWDVAPKEDYFKELFRVSKNQIIWGGNYFGLPPNRCFLIWRKLSIGESFSMAMVEYAWTSFNRNAKMFECTPQGSKDDPRFHPTQKPVNLYRWVIGNYSKQGDRILDTHLGSGSSAIAAWESGHQFVGIEIDGEYYGKAVERLRKHTAQGRLF